MSHSDSSEHFELLKRLRNLEDAQRRLQATSSGNGRKLDLLLAKTVEAEEIADLTSELKQSEEELQAAIDAATYDSVSPVPNERK